MLPGLSGIELCRRLRQAVTPPAPADHHADRARRGRRPGARLRHRRRRLRREAVLRARADGARQGAAAADAAAELRRRRADGRATSSSTARPCRSRAAGATMHLGPTEYRLLEFFMEARAGCCRARQLLDGVWGRDVYIDERTVDVHIGRLRKALMRGLARRPDPHGARGRLQLRGALKSRPSEPHPSALAIFPQALRLRRTSFTYTRQDASHDPSSDEACSRS